MPLRPKTADDKVLAAQETFSKISRKNSPYRISEGGFFVKKISDIICRVFCTVFFPENYSNLRNRDRTKFFARPLAMMFVSK